ncbi:hypothetical protein CL634_03630 [bacterium]|nr:hypothetical protein [bacterium]
MPIYKKINKNFFKKWSSEMAYVLGFFFADGSLDVNPRGAHYFSFHITDKVLLYSIRKTLRSNHKITRRTRPGNGRDQYRMQVGSIEMCNDLRNFGIREQKSKTMHVPDIPSKYIGDFIRGYFDGDGNVWVGEINKQRNRRQVAIRVTFTSASRNFLVSLQNILLKHNLSLGSFIENERFCRLQYSINDSIMLSQIMYSRTGLDDLYLKRKKRVFDSFMKMRA